MGNRSTGTTPTLDWNGLGTQSGCGLEEFGNSFKHGGAAGEVVRAPGVRRSDWCEGVRVGRAGRTVCMMQDHYNQCLYTHTHTHTHTHSLKHKLSSPLPPSPLTLEDVPRIGAVSVLLVVAVTAHSDWLAILDGRAADVVAGHLCLVHLPLLPGADFLHMMTVT